MEANGSRSPAHSRSPGRARHSFALELNPQPLRFAPVSSQAGDPSVFYDECNRQVFVVRNEGATVQVLSTEPKNNLKLTLPRQGEIQSMRFSPDNHVLAIRRSPRTIAFQNFDGGSNLEYIQNCRGRGATELRGFFWTYPDEIVLVTTQGLELYQVLPKKRTLKALKSINVTVMWCSYSADLKILLLASSPQSNVLHPFYMERGAVIRLSKIDVELPPTPSQTNFKLPDRDVVMARLYNRNYIMVVKNNPKGYIGAKAEVILYLIDATQCKKTDVLLLDVNGRFMINVVDNLIVIHHQISKTSLIFDIKAKSKSEHEQAPAPVAAASAGGAAVQPPRTHLPIMPPVPMALVQLGDQNVPPYADSWIAFQPDIIIDARLGALWNVQLRLSDFPKLMADKVTLVDVLLRRQNSKAIILGLLAEELLRPDHRDLALASRLFELVAMANASATRKMTRSIVQSVDQTELYNNIFSPLSDDPSASSYLVSLAVEYIRRLNHSKIPVQHFIYEVVINTLVRQGQFYQLHLFLQYHVVDDSEPVACQLLSLEKAYPPAFQLALDMFKRLGQTSSDLYDVLLTKNHLLQALRFARSQGKEAIAAMPVHRFLETAKATGDDMLFYTVFMFFRERNMQLRRDPAFSPNDNCGEFERYFVSLFGPPPPVFP